ncbi:uncharacterized protein METZ01_LOCUS104301 [marine metagenome]|uniref:Uncharacterized protein n=1 Tax=marine metagenome TaxID=408172 RepID=A0A381WHM8_9ZZZZ
MAGGQVVAGSNPVAPTYILPCFFSESGIFKNNNYAGSNIIDFQVFFLNIDGKTIGPFPMIGASKRF